MITESFISFYIDCIASISRKIKFWFKYTLICFASVDLKYFWLRPLVYKSNNFHLTL